MIKNIFILLKNCYRGLILLSIFIRQKNFPKGEAVTALGSHRENVSSSPTVAYMGLDTLSAGVSLPAQISLSGENKSLH